MQTDGHALYEPKLVELWEKRYHDFETDETLRRLREAKARMNAKMRLPRGQGLSQERPRPRVA